MNAEYSVFAVFVRTFSRMLPNRSRTFGIRYSILHSCIYGVRGSYEQNMRHLVYCYTIIALVISRYKTIVTFVCYFTYYITIQG